MAAEPPLTGLRVLELAGLAPGPFCGLLLADNGASVLRLDRPDPKAYTSTPPPPTGDFLTRRKSSITIDLKAPSSRDLLLSLIPKADVLIDPFRPGVLERLGLDPKTVLLKLNPRLIICHVTGFRRDGKYKDMAGHDINYLAVSGVLSMIGTKAKPLPPGNILADFAGGGAMAFLGVLLALISREKTGKGQIVEANMVDGASYLATMPRLATKSPSWNAPRGENMLDGGCPYYGTYETADGGFMSVGALEPQFYELLLKGLGLTAKDLLPNGGERTDKKNWEYMQPVFEKKFKEKSRKAWEDIFDGTDACVAPVLGLRELEDAGYEQRPAVGVTGSPSLPIQGHDGDWTPTGLRPGHGGLETLKDWCGWTRGRDYEIEKGALVRSSAAKL